MESEGINKVVPELVKEFLNLTATVCTISEMEIGLGWIYQSISEFSRN